MIDINIKSSTVEKSLDIAKEFLQKLIGPSIEELGLLYSDNVKMWRLKNQITNLGKVKKIVEDEGLSLKQVNLKVLFPYLEGVSLEDNEVLQDMWARLFVNYIDSTKNLKINVYPNILRQLSSNEVAILNYMRKDNKTLQANGHLKTKDIEFNDEEVANLERLGILREQLEMAQYGGSHDEENGEWKWDIEESGCGTYYITSFGHEFLKACDR